MIDQYIWWPGLAVTASMVVFWGVLWVWEEVNKPK